MKKTTTIALTLFFLLTLSITAAHAATPWKVSGIYLEACNCDIPCQCTVGGMPTNKLCESFVNWHIVHGFYGDVSLNDLDVSMMFNFPKEDGKYDMATYISDKASPEQFEAIKNIVQEFMSGLIAKDYGTKSVPINFAMSGDTYTWSLPSILEIKSTLNRDMPDSPGFYAQIYHQAEGMVYKYKDYDKNWDYSGKNSFQGRLLFPQEKPSDKVVGTIRVGVGPGGIAVNSFTQVAVVGNIGAEPLYLVDLKTQKVIKTISAGNMPSPAINSYTNKGIIVSMNNGTIYQEGSVEVTDMAGTVSSFDLATGVVGKPIPVGKNTGCPEIDPSGNFAVFANTDDNNVMVFDMNTEKIIKTIPVGSMPNCMHECVNPYTNQAITALMGENALSVIDLTKGVEIKKIPVGSSPYGASLNPYTNIAVVPNMGSNDVSVVDLTAGKVISTIPVGKTPNCSVIEPTMNLAFVPNFDDDTVSIINLNTLSVIDTITVGVQPVCHAINEANGTVVLCNLGSNDLTIVDLKQYATVTEDFSNTFFMTLHKGLNMISPPLKPNKEMNARDLMKETGSTIAIKYDTDTGRFVGFSEASSGDGFPIEGGMGYIINVKESKVVPFVGSAWTNEPSALAPPSEIKSSGWAFVISGILADKQGGSYTATVRNLRTGDVSTDLITADRFNVVFADLNRNPVVKAGDKVEIVVKDISGNVVAGPVTEQIGAGDVQRAFSDIIIRFGSLKPQNSTLLQNYPNPFNPETWIPFNLSKEADVSVMIYDANGRLVRNLALGRKDAGVYTDKDRAIYWDGKSDAGEDVSSGVYFYTMKAGEFSATRKMIVKK